MSDPNAESVIGTMVGTSLDGLDAALVRFVGDRRFEVEECSTSAFSEVDPDRLRAVASGAATTATELSALAFALARDHARAVDAVDPAGRASLVGAHGVTVSHAPGDTPGHGWQLLSGAALAALSRRDVACDFRRADIALGGQGAPLAPVADLRLRSSGTEDRVVLNLGGIANFTVLPKGVSSPEGLVAGDAGPANLVLDGFMRRESGGRVGFDEGGALGLAGIANEDVVTTMLDDPWFARPLPRSAGREEFGDAWLDRFLGHWPEGASAADRMATLVAICARAVADQLRPFAADGGRLLVTGGGRHNRAVLAALDRELPSLEVEAIEAIGENGDAKEAVDFAWLALQRRRNRASGIAAVTGACADLVAGALYHGAPR